MPRVQPTMRPYPSAIAFTPAVKQLRTAKGPHASDAHMEAGPGWQTRVTPDLDALVAGLDMFYLGMANAEGPPSLPDRGGPPGFLKVLDDQPFVFADLGGTRQDLTVGHRSENPQALLFLTNDAPRQRSKVWGPATVAEDNPHAARLSALPVVNRIIVHQQRRWP